MSVLTSTYLVLWYTSFVDDGVITEEESQELYQRAVAYFCIVTLCAAIPIGLSSDKVPSTILMPFSFAFRSIAGYLFVSAATPESPYPYILIIWLTLGTCFESFSANIVFFRGLPASKRGIMMSGMMLSAKLGQLIFSLIAGQTFDLLGRYSPFVILGIVDTLCAILAVYFVKTGRLKDS